MKPLTIGNLTATVPVVQGGMGVGISLSSLAGSVAACGGIGVISTAQIGWREPDFGKNPFEANFRALKKEVAKARQIAPEGIVGVNIMVASRRYEDYVQAAVEAGVDLIISGAGLPINLPKLVQGSQTKIGPVVSSVKATSVICKMWSRKFNKIPDFIIIEGPKAGGHLGFTKEELKDIEALEYQQVITDIIHYIRTYEEEQGCKIPVIVAGGIFHRADMDEMLALGADGVQIGTRFVTTYECDASMEYKNTYIQAQKEDICIVQSPVGMPGRAIANQFLEHVKKERMPIEKCYQCIISCNPATTPYCITQALVNAVEGNVEEGLLFCGSNAYQCTKLEHVADIMREFQ